MVGNKVYLVISDTEYGTFASAYSTEEKAINVLQGLLDDDDDIQYAARQNDIPVFTAQMYLDNVLCDYPVESWYYIQESIVQ